MGRLIVMEGIDGSGKSTQFAKLCETLTGEGIDYHKIVFPQYSEPSSALIRMYLGGEFGSNPNDVSAYVASAFFAVDRFASYRKVWGSYYEAGGLVVADRYATSNAIHQACKLPADERETYFAWLRDFEFGKLGLPEPDAVIYMDLPLEAAVANMRRREAATHTTADIHEADNSYLVSCLESAHQAADYFGWHRIACTENGEMRPIEAIAADVRRVLADCGI